MEEARSWLESGDALSKQGVASAEKLGGFSKAACTAAALLAKVQKSYQTLDNTNTSTRSHSQPSKVAAADGSGSANPDLIPIAVEDLKVIVQLVKVVVTYGVYPCLPKPAAGKLASQIKPWQAPPAAGEVLADSTEVQAPISTIFKVLEANDDVSRQVLLSPYFPYIMYVLSFTPERFMETCNMFPTFHLYKYLLHLLLIDPSNLVAKYKLTSLIPERKNAVLSLVEIIFRPVDDKTVDIIDTERVQQMVLILASPISVPPVMYIKALGTQLFNLLISPDKVQSEAISLVIQRLALVQPRLVGELRNLIVEPFEMKGGRVSQSLLALYRLAFYGNLNKSENMFAQHLCDKLSVAIWFLAVSTFKDKAIPEIVVQAMLEVIKVTPQCIVKIVEALLIQSLPGNLVWHINKEGEPSLIPSISSHQDEESITKRIDDRLDCLVLIIKQLDDTSVTRILLLLVQLYTLESSRPVSTDINDAINVLLHAKTIERLTKDPEIKSKLFETPNAIVEFAFSVIRPKVTACAAKKNRSNILDGTSTASKLSENIASLTVGDSDDEDEEDGNLSQSNEDAQDVAEDYTMLDLALSLLGTAIMESVDGKDEKTPLVLNPEQKQLLHGVVNNDAFPRQLRARAGFCWELVNQDSQPSKPLDTSNNADVLRAAHAALAEPLVPSRAYGLHLISNLLDRDAISLEEAMDIFLRELGDDDSYIYLNALKGIESAGRKHDTSKIINYILPLVSSSNKSQPVDTALRVREALIRLLSPGSLHKVSEELINTLVQDINASARDKIDYRFRLSSAAVLGIIVFKYPGSFQPHMINVIADCALGILRFEKDNTPLRRSAAVLCLELVNAANTHSDFKISDHLWESLTSEMDSIKDTSSDITLVEHCKAVLGAMALTA